jgi:hypothetical protein
MRKILIRHSFSRVKSRVERALAVTLLMGLMALAHCSRAPAEQLAPAASTATPPASPSAAPPLLPPPSANSTTTVAAGPGLQWADPARWHRRPASSPMRVAEYAVPHVAGDPTDAECTVITFGPSQGGSLDDNVNRWVRQFNPLSGPPTKATLSVGGMNVTRVEVAGSYHPMMMPGAPAAPSTLPGARLVGAIVEAPSGSWFFKLTGPDATVRAAAPELDGLIRSLHVP